MLRAVSKLFCRFGRHSWMETQWYQGEPTKWVCMNCRKVKYLREG
mgnify:CR=1 FL=1